MSTIKCKVCERQFKTKKLSGTKGRCPSCGTLVPVSDYCAYIPERRWWHLFSAAPIGMKCVALFCSVVCAVFLPCQVLLAVYKLFEGCFHHEGLHMVFGPGFHLTLGCFGFFISPVLVPMIWGAVQARIPYVSFAILAVFWGCWYLVESAGLDRYGVMDFLSKLLGGSFAGTLFHAYGDPLANSLSRGKTRFFGCGQERCGFDNHSKNEGR